MFLISSIGLVSILTTSCNTFIGIGRDMRLAGQGIEKAASKVSGQSTHEADPSGAPVY